MSTPILAPQLLFDPPIKRWSFSVIKKIEKCPFALYLERVARVPQPERAPDHPAERGNRVHKEAELYVKGEGPFTKDLKKCEKEIVAAREAYHGGQHVELEQQWGFTPEWRSVTWKDPDCWGMVKCDLVWHQPDPKIIEVWDYKTGKSFGNEVSHTQQMQIYGVSTFMKYPHVDLVIAKLLYLDEGKAKKVTYTRPQAMVFMPRITERANKVTTATSFPPKPNRQNCRYCDHGVTNGTGVCPYAVAD